MSNEPDKSEARPYHHGDLRRALIEAGRGLLEREGIAALSLRAVAREAGVDPALVHHFFGTKEQLFVAAMQLPVDPAAVVRGLLAEGVEDLGPRVVRILLAVWDTDEATPLFALLRSAVAQERAAAMLREFLTGAVLTPLAAALDVDRPRLRTSLAASQLMGLAVARYLIRIEPLASAPAEEVAAAVRAAAAGATWLSWQVAPHVIGAIAAGGGGANGDELSTELSPRELEILRLVAAGLDNGEIGAQLFLSPSTVKSYLSSIFSKLGLENRVQAAVYATERGL